MCLHLSADFGTLYPGLPGYVWLSRGLLACTVWWRPGFPDDPSKAGAGGRERVGDRVSRRRSGSHPVRARSRSRTVGEGGRGSSVDGNRLAAGVQGLNLGKHYCPVAGCDHAEGGRFPGWQAKHSLKTHVDNHLAGGLRGTPTVDWLRTQGWAVCPGCGLTACADIICRL